MSKPEGQTNCGSSHGSPPVPSRDIAVEARVQAWAYRHGPYPGDSELALAIQWCIEGWAYQRDHGMDVLASAELEQAIELSQFAQEL